jgi:hypothetical protein
MENVVLLLAASSPSGTCSRGVLTVGTCVNNETLTSEMYELAHSRWASQNCVLWKSVCPVPVVRGIDWVRLA